MKKINLALSLFVLSNFAYAGNSCIEKKCGEPPSYFLLDQKGAELKKAEEIIARFNQCVTSCSHQEKDEIDNLLETKVYTKEKDQLDFCEKMLPKVLKDSYEMKVLNVANITKKSPTAKELNKMILNRVIEKRNLCQAHLDGKFDKEIYPQKMGDLKFCFERMKDKKAATKEYDQFQKIKVFIDNRVNKKMLDSTRSSDLINVQNKLDDCKQSMADYEAAQVAKSNQSERSKFKTVPVEDTSPIGTASTKAFQK